MPSPIPVAFAGGPITVGDNGIRLSGPALVTCALDFTGPQTYVLDATLLQAAKTFGIPRSIYVNNSQNPNLCLITIQGTGSIEQVPAFSIGLLPITALANSKIFIQSTGGAPAGSTVEVELYNYERPPYVYGGLGPFQPGSQVEALAQNAASFIPRNTTLGAAVAANVFPTVAATRQVMFKNVGDGAGGGDVAYWNVGNTASGVFASGDQLLQVGDGLLMPFRTLQRISFYSPNGTRIQGVEWSD